MANRFWVGGNANWDATAGTKWATTSGGAGGAAVPTAADDVFLDNGAGTGNVTIPASTTVSCRSLNCTGYIKVLTFAATTSLMNVGDATAGASNVALLFVSGMTLTLTAVGTITLQSTSATVQTITSGGKTLPNITINGTGSKYQIADNTTLNSGATFLLTTGEIDYNGLNFSAGAINISGAVARTVKMNAANLTCTTVVNAWNAGTTTNLTAADLGSSGTITLTGSGSNLGATGFIGGGLTYNNVTLSNVGVSSITGTNTFGTLTFTAGAAATTEYRLANNQTVTGTVTFNGNTVANRGCLRSNTIGTTRTVTAATVSSNGFFDFMDITGAGAGTWSNSGWGISSVSGITGATPVTTYYVGGTGNSNDATKYASSSGGTANTQRAPLMQDTAYYDANSGSGTLTINSYRIGTIDFTNTALTGVSISGGFVSRYFAGDFILSPSAPITFSGFADAMNWCGRGSQTLTTAGTTFSIVSLSINTTGTYTLGSSFTAPSLSLTVTLGTFDASTYDVNVTSFTWSNLTTINCGTGNNWNISADAGTICVVSAGATVNKQTSRINLLSVSNSAKTFSTGGKSFPDIVISAGGTGTWTFNATATYNSISMSGTGTKSIIFTAGTTATILNNNWLRGRSGNLITITSSAAGSPFTLAYTGTVVTDYISLKDCTASGGTPFYAGINSTNVSGNTNWNFTDSPFGNMFLVM